jgi:hypothetical protein
MIASPEDVGGRVKPGHGGGTHKVLDARIARGLSVH